MKKLYFLLFTILITASSLAQTTVFQENFEVGNSATASEDCNDMAGDFFTRTDGTNIGSFYSVSGQEGNWWFAAMDTDGAPCTNATQTLLFDDIDISGNTNLTLAMLFAEDDSGDGAEDWDGGDLVFVEVDYDNSGTFTKVIQFATTANSGFNVSAPTLDTDFDGIGDGAELTSAFAEFTASLGTGNLVDIRITFDGLAAGDEDISIDDIRIVENFVATPSITLTSPANGTVFNPGTATTNIAWTTANTNGTEMVNVLVDGSLVQMDAPNPYELNLADGQSYLVRVELVDGGVLDFDEVSFSVGSSTQVADVAALRAGTEGEFYELTGEAIISYIVTENTRNQKYIQDATGGILIDDAAGTLVTALNIGDGLTGLTGQLGSFNGVLQFVPTENILAASSTGNTITPEIVTLANFVANGEDYESELIQIDNLTFADGNGTNTFSDNTNYSVSSGADMGTVRVSFGDENLINATIPSTAGFVIGLGGEFNGAYQLLPRYGSDVENAVLSNTDFTAISFSLYPNPTSQGYVNISTVNNDDVKVAVYDILGKQVKNETLRNDRLDVSNLKSGVYLLRITQNEATVTKKLVIN